MKLAALALSAALLAPGCSGRAPTPAPQPTAPPPEAPAQPHHATTCCTQCDAAASQDPSGFDISLVACSEYARTPGVISAECQAWFAANPKMVQDCWRE